MFQQAVIHYPTDENDLAQICKDIAAFRCAAVVKYIETLNLNDSQIEMLFSSIEGDISGKQQQISLNICTAEEGRIT